MEENKYAKKEFDTLFSYITKNNLRNTPQRLQILKIFLETEGHNTPEDLFEKVSKINPAIGIATVRRALNLFVECKLAEKAKFKDGKTVYEHRHSHHDHLICLNCGEIKELINEDIESLVEKEAIKNGFNLINHRLEIYGYCSKCYTGN